MSLSVYIDDKKKDILILGFDQTFLIQYSINFSRSNRKILFKSSL